VRRVHVDQHEARAVLRDDVDAVQLREREAERCASSLGSAGSVRSPNSFA
jgi:hypothetical protein